MVMFAGSSTASPDTSMRPAWAVKGSSTALTTSCNGAPCHAVRVRRSWARDSDMIRSPKARVNSCGSGLLRWVCWAKRLDDGERVLDPVIELVEQQALALLRRLQVGDVDQHAHHAQRLAGGVALDLAAVHHPAHLAVGPADTVGELVLMLGGEDLPLAPGDLPAVVGMYEIERRIEIAVLARTDAEDAPDLG